MEFVDHLGTHEVSLPSRDSVVCYFPEWNLDSALYLILFIHDCDIFRGYCQRTLRGRAGEQSDSWREGKASMAMLRDCGVVYFEDRTTGESQIIMLVHNQM